MTNFPRPSLTSHKKEALNQNALDDTPVEDISPQKKEEKKEDLVETPQKMKTINSIVNFTLGLFKSNKEGSAQK